MTKPMHFHRDQTIIIGFVFLLKCLRCQYQEKLSMETRPEKSWTEKVLINELLNGYDKRSRPVVDNLTPVYRINTADRNQSIQQVTVEFGLSLIQIMKLDEMDQILTSNVRTLYRWKDYHMRWKPHLYDNITHVHIPTKYLWLPDISIYNYADERMEERRECDAIIKYDGTVEWHPMAIFKSTCPVRIKYFPFDRQCCKLKFGPWTYDGFRLNITFYDNKTELDQNNYVANVEWELIKTRAKFTTIRYPCCLEPYPDISFHILVQRNSAFYNYILILPCFLLSSLTLVLFWLPAESPAKMVLGMNIFIAFFLLVVLLEKSIPSASSSFPLIGTYYCINMTLITLSTFLCLITVNFHFRGDNRKEVPFWLKKLTIKHGARILFVDLGFILKKPPPVEKIKTKQCINPSFLNKAPPKHLPSSDFIDKTIQGTQFYDQFYQSNFPQRNQNSNIHYLHSNHMRNIFESSDVRNSRPNTPDCAADVPPVFDRYPTAESISGNEDELDDDLDFRQQHQQNGNYFKEYEEDLEEFLTECIQSPIPSQLAASWASYNSAGDFSNSFKQPGHEMSLHSRCQQPATFDLKCNPNFEKPILNQHSVAPINVFVARRINLVTKDISDIIKDLTFIQKTNENKERVNKIVSEWRAVGLVLDRFFFMLYVIAIILSLILFFPKAGNDPYYEDDNSLNCEINS